jgi:hypothetical protein
VATIACPKCGDPNADSTRKYCHQCGGRLDDEGSTVAAKEALQSPPKGTAAAPAHWGTAAKPTKYMSQWTFGAFSAAGWIVAAVLSGSMLTTVQVITVPIAVGVVLTILGYKIGKPNAKDQQKTEIERRRPAAVATAGSGWAAAAACAQPPLPGLLLN